MIFTVKKEKDAIYMPGRIGEIFGSYELIQFLGRGGFAEVYLGKHTQLPQQMAAIKILDKQLIIPKSQQFQKEASIVATLHHPNIVQMYGRITYPLLVGLFGLEIAIQHILTRFLSGRHISAVFARFSGRSPLLGSLVAYPVGYWKYLSKTAKPSRLWSVLLSPTRSSSTE